MDVFTGINRYIYYIRAIERLSSKTIYDRSLYLNDYGRWLAKAGIGDAASITLGDVRGYLASKQHLRRNSLSAVMSILRMFHKYLQEDEGVEIKFSLDKLRPISPGRVNKIIVPVPAIEQVVREAQDEQLKIIIYLLFGSGFRVSELARLRVENLHGDYATVVNGKGRYGGKTREVRIHPAIMTELRKFLEKNGRHSGYIVQRRQVHKNVDQTKPVDTDTINRWLKVFEKYGYHVTPHIARYSFATNMYLEGADITTVQISLGHESVETTQRYLHIPPEYIRDQFDRCMTLQPVGC